MRLVFQDKMIFKNIENQKPKVSTAHYLPGSTIISHKMALFLDKNIEFITTWLD